MPGIAERISSAIERATVLDSAADAEAALLGRVLKGHRDLLSGKALGHPAHPAAVALPMGFLLSASAVDVLGGRGSRSIAKRLIALGIVSAAPAALTGASDWLDTEQAERRVGFVHAALNSVALSLYAASWVSRSRGKHLRGAGLALAGGGVLGGSGWLGGHLAYALGVGVDTTAFSHVSTEWTDVGAAAEVAEDGARLSGHAEHTPVVVVRTANGLVALADRCTHRGAPLHEGEIRDGCIVCPWHASEFDLTDGSVVRGPATRPQPAYEVRTVDGRVQVRRADEQRSLRTNPV